MLGGTPNKDCALPNANPLVACCAAKTAGLWKSRKLNAEEGYCCPAGFDLASIALVYTFGRQPVDASVAT